MTGPFRIDPGLPTAPYEQLKEQISQGRQSGRLPAGHRLPPVRQLAAEVGLAPNTVARAYRELEHSGVIETRGRAGSFIAPPDAAQHLRAREAARRYGEQARALGLNGAEALRLLEEELSIMGDGADKE
ncbi:MAG: GntR family transcriptional regulator [Propioniciclava sp.]